MIEGNIEADSELAAVARLRKMEFIVLDIKEVRESIFKKMFRKSRKVKAGEIVFFTRQLAAMLAAGIPLTRSLYALYEQEKNPVLARALNDLAQKVEGGMSFSEVLTGYPGIFSRIFVDMVRAGEIGGTLDEMLLRLAGQLEREKRLRDSIRSATMYPAMIIGFSCLILVAMLLFVVPIFTGFFPPEMELPLPTQLVMLFSDTLRSHWYLYLLFPFLLFLGLRAYTASDAGQRAWDSFKFRLPVIGDLFRKDTLARFSRTLATMLGGGIPVLQALEVSGAAAGSYLVRETIRLTGIEIQEGQNISKPLTRSGFFPPMMVNMVAVGEETGQLPELLDKVADFFEEEVATMAKGLTSMLEPVLLIFTGIIIGSMIIAVYLPIFMSITTVAG